MASFFHSGPTAKCQGIDCKGGDHVTTYSIKEQQDLCEDCVSRKAQTVQNQDQGKIGDDWSCEKHRKPIEFVCRSHGLPLCQACAFLSHQKPCIVQDVEDVVSEKRSRLENLLPTVAQKRQELQEKASKIRECGDVLEQHFKDVKDKLAKTFGKEVEDVDSWEKEESEILRKEADEQIRKIEEQLKTAIDQKRRTAETKRVRYNSTKQRLVDDLLRIEERTIGTVDCMKSQLNRLMDSVENAELRLGKMVLDERDLIHEAEGFESLLTRTVDTDISVDVLERTAQKGMKVHFEGGSNILESKVRGAEESWELVDRVSIGKDLTKPYFIGAIDEEQMVVSDIARRTLFVTNLKDKGTTKVLERSGDYRKIVSCTAMGKETILCGNFCKDVTGHSFKGASLYNRDWKFIRDVELPKNPEVEKTFASVHVEKGGRILAAVACQSDILIINPIDGTIEQSLKTSAEKIQWLCSLPSGNFVAKTGACEFTIMDSSGSHQACIKHDRWDGCLCDVDLSDGSLYVVYRDKERMVYAVDVMSSDGKLVATNVVEYPVSKNRKDVVLPCVVTSSGKLVTCNGENFYVFKRKS